MPLYGHELGEGIMPVQSGLGRVVNLAKEVDFVGRTATEAGPPDGARVLVGLAADGKRAGRAEYPVLDPDGTKIGFVSGSTNLGFGGDGFANQVYIKDLATGAVVPHEDEVTLP